MASVLLAYNSTNSIPADGNAARRTFTVVLAKDWLGQLIKKDHELVDGSLLPDVLGNRLRLTIHFGAAILSSSTDRTWIMAFLKAKFRWVVVGDFKDTANSANANLCQADVVNTSWDISVEYDRTTGYELVSVKLL